jgi:hypothetical protein
MEWQHQPGRGRHTGAAACDLHTLRRAAGAALQRNGDARIRRESGRNRHGGARRHLHTTDHPRCRPHHHGDWGALSRGQRFGDRTLAGCERAHHRPGPLWPLAPRPLNWPRPSSRPCAANATLQWATWWEAISSTSSLYWVQPPSRRPKRWPSLRPRWPLTSPSCARWPSYAFPSFSRVPPCGGSRGCSSLPTMRPTRPSSTCQPPASNCCPVSAA